MPWNNTTIRKDVCNVLILDVCRRSLQHGFMWSKWTWHHFQNVRNRYNNLSSFMWYYSWNLSCSRLFTISKFLTQVASKSCRSMQLFGLILNLFDIVAEVWNTSWCCQTKQNVMTWGYGFDRKLFHLLHGMVFLTYVLWIFNGNVVSDLRVGDA